MAIYVSEGPRETVLTEDLYLNSSYVSTNALTCYAKGANVYGENTVGYWRAKKNGELLPFTTWYQSEAQEFEYTAGDIYTQWVSAPHIRADVPGALFPNELATSYEPPAPNTDGVEYMLQSAASDIYAEGWDALTFAVELPKTGKMIENFGKKAYNLARGLSRKRVLDMWLEGRYGWRTLAYDVRDIHHAMTEMEQRRDIYTERKGFKRPISDSSYVVHTDDNFTYHVHSSLTAEQSVRGSIAAKFDAARIRTNVIETAWELVPFSFVLDWVYDVGTAIRAASLGIMAEKYYAAVGFKQTYTFHQYVQFISNSANRTAGRASGSRTWTGEVTSRIPTTLSYKPQVTNRLLTPDLALDLTALSRVRRQISSRR